MYLIINLCSGFETLYFLSELVQLKLNIEASGGDSTPPEAETGGTPLLEVGVSPLDNKDQISWRPFEAAFLFT